MSKQIWTPGEVLDRIRALSEAGHDLASGSATKMAPRLVSAAWRLFGSWRRAVEELGIDYSSVAKSACQRAAEKRSKWSKERIVERIRELSAKNESLEAVVVKRKHMDLYGSARSPRYFKGWDNALEAAGLRVERNRPGRPSKHTAALIRWKAELLLERISQIAGGESAIDEGIIRGLEPALHEATVKRFGSWAKALDALQGGGKSNGTE